MSKSSRVFVCLWLTAFVASLSYAVTPDRIASAIDASQSFELTKSWHPSARAEFDRGAVDPSFKLTYMTLSFKPSPTQQQALNQLLADQQNPKSRYYHQWLTPAQYADRFGLSKNDINRVTDWLKSRGFQIVSVGGGRNSVTFSGTAAQVTETFQTEIHNFNVNGEQHIANASPVKMPAALNGMVAALRGLHDFRPRPANRQRGLNLTPGLHSNYFDGNYLFPNFLAPADVATIYDINPLYTASTPIDGTGQKIAIVGQTDIFLDDINDFRTGFGMTPISGCTTTGTNHLITACNTSNFQYVLLGTDPGTIGGDITEADLDIQWSGAIAPKAQIIFVNAETLAGVDDALAAAINPPSGPPLAFVISMSYGSCEAKSGDQETELAQAAGEGVTVLVSTGDVGATTCDRDPPPTLNNAPPFPGAVGGYSVSYPASSPSVVAVGGTGISIANDSNTSSAYWGTSNGTNGLSALKYIPELAWNDDEVFGAFCASNQNLQFCNPGAPAVAVTNAQTFQEDYWLSIAGGGASNCFGETAQGVCTAGFPQPTFQQGLSVANAPAGVRYVPDISFLASPNLPGYIFCTPQNPGGTPPVNTSTCVTGISTAVDTYLSIVGGTSVSTPVFAGIVALMNQYLAGSQSTGLGNINPVLYDLAKNRNTNHAFNQATGGDNKVYCQPGTPTIQPASIQCPAGGVLGFNVSDADATTGYNLVTGLGSVDVNNLAIAWAGSRTTTTTSLSPSTTNAYQTQSVTLTATITPSSATGSITFKNGTATLGTVALSSGSAQLTTSSLPVGANSITASFAGSATLGASVSTAQTVTVVQAYTLQADAASYPVTPGQTATINVTVNTNGSGFNSPLTFTCSDLAPESTCTGPTGATTQTTVSFTVKTTPPTAELRMPGREGRGIFYAVLLPGLFGIMLTFGARKRSLRGMRLLGLILVMGFSTMWLGSCGGSNGGGTKDPGTTKGQYNVTISATSGAGGATGNVTVQLNVQ